ncbi:MAG: TRAP transporter permease [Firmicutes bacterium]|nr:TRAP transporter permease [Bacillota bacterium]MDH7495216.1 TRAP transporter permease [Bacillota bacterium]
MTARSENTSSSRSGPRRVAGIAASICSIIAVAFAVFEIWSNSFSFLPTLKINAIHLAFLMALCFLLYPARRGASRDRIPAVDWILAIVGAGCALYFCFSFDALYNRGMIPLPRDYVVAVIGILLVLEAGRRSTGPILPVLAIVFLLYARFGRYVPGVFAHGGFPWSRIVSRMFMTDAGVFGTTLTISSTYLFLFVLFGEFLAKSGVGEFFNDFAFSLIGHRRGGPAQVSVVSSALMGTISGSSIANVATTGSFTIPLMKRIGYTPDFAGAVEATASTGGMIMPPIMGAAAFLMAGFLGVPYTTIMVAGIIPAILYYLSLFFVIDMEAQQLGLQGLPKADLPRLGRVLKEKGYLIVPVLVIIYALISGLTAITSAFAGLISTVLVSFVSRKSRMGLKKIVEALAQGARSIVPIGLACAVVGFIVGVTGMTALGSVVAYNMIELARGSLILALVFVLLASLVASMGLPATACYVVVATIAAPALVRMNVPPLAAHFFVFWFGCLSGITPPVALASYTAAGIAGSSPNKTAMTALRLAAPGFLLPFLLVYRPELLGLHTTLSRFLVSVGVAAVACLSTACCTHGYLMGRLSTWERALMGVGSLMLVNPDMWSYVGVTIIIAVIAYRWYRMRTGRNRSAGVKLQAAARTGS